ncbi:hypothetical protein CLHUN_21840 [Ruminiclostridium hungatei]|uniref:GyrI-like small molecule binding domain-containing protein n=1 Tax=Ruminiclostridium hungatei TaxID=48256 RepID=A0A1V4SL41_RUMHU|nr:GyrI-like domain-containing protein [Ruminiclostridium hungatei]OPX43941.1 hypothetical protein CLHUN_21840 [Ruminiclostridium hungatei]
MAEKFDFKKEYKDLYMPKETPRLLEVPSMNFVCVNGTGDPDGPDYEKAVGILYGVSFTIKMSKMTGEMPEGYFDYVVPPLEGLWWYEDGEFDFYRRENWLWTSMIRQPDFVSPEVFERAVSALKKKKPELDTSRAKLMTFTEGLCVQMLHKGPYATEPQTVAEMKRFLEQNGLSDETGLVRKHHEIYLSDPRRTAPDKLRTVLRHPAKRNSPGKDL